ncbi:MAG: tetratricopeptide repeat protein [Pyrinomonadaceae bacterium]
MRLIDLTAGIVSLVLFCFSSHLVSAQTRVNSSGTGGIHTIQGKVYAPSGRSIDSSVTVRLEVSGSGDLTLITDQNGGYAFQNLAPGNYSIVVEGGDNFENVRESVTIDQDLRPLGGIPIPPTPKIFNVPIYLQLKRNVQLKNEVLNAKLANVPKDALTHYAKGQQLAQNNKVDDAIGEFRSALTEYPTFTECYLEIGKLYLTHGKIEDAINSFRNAIKLEPKNFEAHVNLGISLLNEKKYDEAEPELVTAAYLNRAAVTPHYYIGLIYAEKRQYDIAQKAFETAQSLPGGDTFPLLHRYLGGIYANKGMNKEAAEELAKYLRLDPNAKDADKIRQTISELKAKPQKLNVFS